MNWGNSKVQGIIIEAQGALYSLHLILHLEGDVKEAEKKISCVVKSQDLVPVYLVDFNYVITKDKIEKDEDISAWINPKIEFRSEAWAD